MEKVYLGPFLRVPLEELIKTYEVPEKVYRCCGETYSVDPLIRQLEGEYCSHCGKLLQEHPLIEGRNVREYFWDKYNFDEDEIYVIDPCFDEPYVYFIPEGESRVMTDSDNRPRTIWYDNIQEDIEKFTKTLAGSLSALKVFTGKDMEYCVEYGMLYVE